VTEALSFPPEWFARQDESPDPDFFAEARLVVHIDDATIEAARSYFTTALPNEGVFLDLMSSWRSHLPHNLQGHVVGLGMNEVELAENPQLQERIIHDLNANPALPLPDAWFDAVFVTVSIQYMTRPLEIFTTVCRILKPGAQFHILFSDRMFPTKAVAIWSSLPSAKERAELIATYFALSGNWEQPEFFDRSPGHGADPLYVVRASKKE